MLERNALFCWEEKRLVRNAKKSAALFLYSTRKNLRCVKPGCQVSPECARKNKPPAPLARVGRAQFSPRAMASHAAFRAPLGRQLGTRSTCRSSSSPSLRAALVPVRRGAARSARRVVALDRSREGGLGGDDGAMDTNVLYERMRALQAKEASENSAIVEAAIEKDQAIVAGIKGDAAERPTPERACHERALRCAPPRAMRPRSHQSVYWYHMVKD